MNTQALQNPQKQAQPHFLKKKFKKKKKNPENRDKPRGSVEGLESW